MVFMMWINFLSFFKVDLADLKEHWDADEDQDWEDGEDLNNDGVYQVTEFFGDDIGLDGVAPTELNYTGPDEGEGNHKPDYVEGVGSEPNFAVTDVSESDMMGLTAFRLFPVPSHAQSNSSWWFKNDEAMWALLGENILEEYMDQISNLIEVFASGPFPLYKGRTERISMSELHSYDPLEGLNSPAHTAPALYELKKIVQVIYEKDYRFAQPPKMPTLTATPADGKVILTWDNISDTRTRDPFLGNINDFEGYKLFRATDKYFSDAEVITDGYGTPMFMKPIFQCDLKDGKFGFTDFGLVNGVGYNLGSDTGISHVFVDNTVMNGRTYYYGLVAYDYGAPHIGPGISPSENNVVVELNEAEEVRSIGKNVAIVTPFKPAAGYKQPDITLDESNLSGGGKIVPTILARSSIKKDHRYQVSFGIDTVKLLPKYDFGLMYTTNSIKVTDLSEDLVVYEETPSKFIGSNLVKVDSLGYWTLNTKAPFSTDVFDGIQLNVDMPFEQGSYDYANSGWVQGSGIMRIIPSIRESSYLAWDYHIIFSSNASVYTSTTSIKTGIRDAVDDRIPTNEILLGQSFGFYVKNETLLKPDGSQVLMDMVVHDVNKNGVFDKSEDKIIVGGMGKDGKWAGTAFVIDFNLASTATYPKSDDIFRVKFSRPFWKDDYLTFTINSYDDIDADSLAKTMDNIRVVPNPYVATNVMEPAVSNQFLNQRRSLMFTNVPAQALIKIFTISGVLVDEISINNSPEKGIVHWDMLTREGLEIAAGMYLFHIEALATGDQKIGKFAVIK